jgi:hypothetical protein
VVQTFSPTTPHRLERFACRGGLYVTKAGTDHGLGDEWSPGKQEASRSAWSGPQRRATTVGARSNRPALVAWRKSDHRPLMGHQDLCPLLPRSPPGMSGSGMAHTVSSCDVRAGPLLAESLPFRVPI